MIANRMPLCLHAPDDLRIFLDKIADHEKSSRHFLLLQHVKKLLRHAVFVARVEGQINLFFARVSRTDIIGLKIREVFRRRVADWRTALVLKRKAPIAVSRRRYRAAGLLRLRRMLRCALLSTAALQPKRQRSAAAAVRQPHDQQNAAAKHAEHHPAVKNFFHKKSPHSCSIV